MTVERSAGQLSEAPQELFRPRDLFGGVMTNSQAKAISGLLSRHPEIEFQRVRVRDEPGKPQIMLDQPNLLKLQKAYELLSKCRGQSEVTAPREPALSASGQKTTIWQRDYPSGEREKQRLEEQRKQLRTNVARTVLSYFARILSEKPIFPRDAHPTDNVRALLLASLPDKDRANLDKIVLGDLNEFLIQSVIEVLDKSLDPKFLSVSQKEQALVALCRQSINKGISREDIMERVRQHFHIEPTLTEAPQPPTG